MKYCMIDTETFSEVDIRLGNDLYSRSAECLIVTYCFSTFDAGKWTDSPTQIWEPWTGAPLPRVLQEAVTDETVIFVAHSAVFDRLILLRALGIRVALRRWRCTRAQAYAHGLPGALDLLGTVLGLTEDQGKLVDDKKLIDTFCKRQGTGRRIMPQDDPAGWQRFCAYAIRDTDALREIYKRLPQHNYTGANLRSWLLDQLINERGFQFDEKLATAAAEFLQEAKKLSDDVIEEASDGEVHAATQRARLLKYLREKCGIDIESLRASDVREWLEHDDLDPVVRVLLEQRLEAGKSSGAKFKRGLAMVGPRGRQRNCIQWNGAGRTGRHSGRGFQPHNMGRPALRVRKASGRIELGPVEASYIDNVILPGIYSKQALNNDFVYGGPFEAAGLAMRHVITAAPGNELVVGDFKNIESVITAWLAGETVEVEAFTNAFANPKDKSLDVYRIQFSQFFGTPVLEVNDTERQAGKVSKLAFGFGGGVGALVTMAAGYQMDLEPLADIVLPRATEEQRAKAYKAWRRAFLLGEDYELEPKVYMACDVLKQVYRATNTAIDRFRHDVDNAIKGAVKRPNEAFYHVGRCKIWSTGAFLIIELPSGRRLLYAHPQIQQTVIADPDGGKPWVSETVTYATARGKSWRREKAWSGLFVENIVQAVANDVLRAAMLRVHDDAWTVPEIAAYLMTLPEDERTAISLHVHDEVVLDVPVGSYPKERLARVLVQREPWMEGLPMAADVWNNFRYGKR
jgi:DNA polymerase bacteriophage-type